LLASALTEISGQFNTLADKISRRTALGKWVCPIAVPDTLEKDECLAPTSSMWRWIRILTR
jgi:hypothetical protein